MSIIEAKKTILEAKKAALEATKGEGHETMLTFGGGRLNGGGP